MVSLTFMDISGWLFRSIMYEGRVGKNHFVVTDLPARSEWIFEISTDNWKSRDKLISVYWNKPIRQGFHFKSMTDSVCLSPCLLFRGINIPKWNRSMTWKWVYFCEIKFQVFFMSSDQYISERIIIPLAERKGEQIWR
jgi:hypothetical protein